MALDDIVQEEDLLEKIGNALYTGFYTTLGAVSTYISYLFIGINGPLTGIAFSSATYIINLFKKIKTKFIDLVKEYNIGVLVGTLGSKLYEFAEVINNKTLDGKIFRGLYGLSVSNTSFTAAYVGTDHIIKNDFNPQGLGEKYKKDYLPILKESTLWLGLPVILTINGYMGGYPGIVAMDAGYRVIAEVAGKK